MFKSAMLHYIISGYAILHYDTPHYPRLIHTMLYHANYIIVMNVCRKNSKQASVLQHSKMQMQQVFKRDTVEIGQC